MRLITSVAAAILLLAVPALAETSVGVTAAVNPSATGTVGSAVRTISLGDNVVYSERIQTGGEGLVQILLADGTTFMVGPNSDLVIDSFVYDPNAGTAAVTATFTKGVLRFIGGQASKNGGNVTLNTPVGTMGIRGAMVDVVLDPPAGTPPHIDMLFGNEVTLEQGQALLGRLYAAGYSLVLGTGGQFDIMKTPPGWGSQVQQALAGKIGTRGGAIVGPSDEEVENSKVAENNSESGRGPDGLTREERDALLQAAAEYDELRRFILANQNPFGFVGGVLDVYSEGNYSEPLLNAFDMEGEDGPGPVQSRLGFNADGDAVSVQAMMGLLGDTCVLMNGCLVYDGGTDGGELTFIPYDDGEPGLPTTIAVDGYVVKHDDADIDPNLFNEVLAAELDCESCDDFIRWGFWGFSGENIEVGTLEGDLDFDATWVTGDLVTEAELGTLASNYESATAYYSGDAVGIVSDANGKHTATGDLLMNWSFADRTGSIGITDFDVGNTNINGGNGVDAGGYMTSFEDQTGFGGWLYANGGVDGWGFGIAQGAFVNNGSEVGAGVMGNFGFSIDDYTASGIFVGEQFTPPLP